MHTGLTVFLNIGSKISKSNMEKFGGTLCRAHGTAVNFINVLRARFLYEFFAKGKT